MSEIQSKLESHESYAMRKVQDIHQDGVAYHILTLPPDSISRSLFRILSCGLISLYDPDRHHWDPINPVELRFKKMVSYWKDMVRKNPSYSEVYFNIIGRRVSDLYTDHPQIFTDEPADLFNIDERTICII